MALFLGQIWEGFGGVTGPMFPYVPQFRIPTSGRGNETFWGQGIDRAGPRAATWPDGRQKLAWNAQKKTAQTFILEETEAQEDEGIMPKSTDGN